MMDAALQAPASTCEQDWTTRLLTPARTTAQEVPWPWSFMNCRTGLTILEPKSEAEGCYRFCYRLPVTESGTDSVTDSRSSITHNSNNKYSLCRGLSSLLSPLTLNHTLARAPASDTLSYPRSCTLVACTHAQSLRLCPLSELSLKGSPPHQKKHLLSRERGRDTIVCAARRLRSAVCETVGQRNEPYPELAVRARTRSTLYYRRRLPGLNTYHTTRRCTGGARR